MLDRGDYLPLAHDRNQSPDLAFALKVEGAYLGLIQAVIAGPGSHQEPSLGGKLLYAAELAEDGRALAVAGNVAGVATLAASADPAAQKQAVRDGVVDFLVNSLDEALRILKNEIRKRETVAVCVAASPQVVEQQMLERGVLPDLLRPLGVSSPRHTEFVALGAQRIESFDAEKHQAVLRWSVAAAPARWLPKLDAIALECLSPGESTARRWLQLAPRYLGRMAQGMRLLACDPESASRFVQQVRKRVEDGEIGVEVAIQLSGLVPCEEHRFLPRENPPRSNA